MHSHFYLSSPIGSYVARWRSRVVQLLAELFGLHLELVLDELLPVVLAVQVLEPDGDAPIVGLSRTKFA